jgi:23S rRNA pseudouridine1911/1915/1917 synthase
MDKRMIPPHILFEDNHLLVVEKPANLPVQADASGDADLLSICKSYIRETYHKPGDAYLGLVHRLDRPVGGVMVFAKTSKAAARLTAQFKDRRAHKRYAAIVEGYAPAEAECVDWLLKDESTNTTRVVPEGTDGAKKAILRFRTLAREDGTSLLDVELLTGRPHQIRVQLSSRGLPIAGDMRYNPNAKPGTQIRLWSYVLTILHPTLNEPLTFYSLPKWTEYPAAIRLLPAHEVCSGVYLDDELLVVDKNAGAEVEDELLGELSAMIDPLYPVHRLDANTEGLVCFARTEATRDRLLDAFRTHGTEKIYHAVVAGRPKDGTYVHYAKKDADAATVRLCRKDEPGAQNMELALRVLDSRRDLSLVEIRLFTGRTHQIRVQMQAIGCPVLGDDKYGDREANKRYKKRRQCLFCKRLTVLGKTFESTRRFDLNDFTEEKR